MNLKGKTIGILVSGGFEDSQVVKAAQVLRQRQAEVVVIGLGDSVAMAVAGRHGSLLKPDLVLGSASPEKLDAIIIPGGDSVVRTRMDERALTLLLAMNNQEKPIGVISNGGAVVAAAGLVAGRRMTGDTAIQRELVEAGATYVEQTVVVDHNLVSARSVDDVTHFIDAVSFFLEPTVSLH